MKTQLVPLHATSLNSSWAVVTGKDEIVLTTRSQSIAKQAADMLKSMGIDNKDDLKRLTRSEAHCAFMQMAFAGNYRWQDYHWNLIHSKSL